MTSGKVDCKIVRDCNFPLKRDIISSCTGAFERIVNDGSCSKSHKLSGRMSGLPVNNRTWWMCGVIVQSGELVRVKNGLLVSRNVIELKRWYLLAGTQLRQTKAQEASAGTFAWR